MKSVKMYLQLYSSLKRTKDGLFSLYIKEDLTSLCLCRAVVLLSDSMFVVLLYCLCCPVLLRTSRSNSSLLRKLELSYFCRYLELLSMILPVISDSLKQQDV